MRNFLIHLGYGLVLGLLAAAGIMLAAGKPRSSPVMLLPTPAPTNLTIDITGAIVKPGVYQLPPNSHVLDAIQAAGGLRVDADVNTLNMAAELSDGQKIIVKTEGQLPVASDGIERSIPIEVNGLIDINTATAEQLDTLPGIGPTKASDIITYRQKNGAFDRIEDIQNVSGIGPATFEAIRNLISVSGGS
ncbi:MAG TPA: helix-hairpin-helix domain-containing protein [Bellilinea sp.]|nr:helix-hairpin-helix domain-containing protein [Bellilinea sp.]